MNADMAQIGEMTLYRGTAETVLPLLPTASVHLILADPPYWRVKAEAWDRQWRTRDAYLDWLRQLAKEWRRVLTPNGSLYCFASPQMAAWVEVTLSETFSIIQRITWQKPPFSTKAEMFDKDIIRMFFPASEAIIFAEQYGSDKPYQEVLINENGSYWTACEKLKSTIFGAYLKEEFARAGVTARMIAALFPSVTGGLTGCVSNWLLGYNCPTADQYHHMREYLNTRNCRKEYLRRDYEYLRRDYEDLRRDYEDLRRPFTVSAAVPYTDVWEFATVPAGPGKHPCEKPLPLLRHMITASSRPGDVVLDPMMGSGSTLEAAQQCGRRAIGIEQDPQWWRNAVARMSQLDMFTALGV